jgi:adenylate kinase
MATIKDPNKAPSPNPNAISGKPRVILISGPPGAGKGVQCEKMVKNFGFIHISTGDIFREAVTRRTELGLLADSYIKRGLFVPDDVVINLVKARLLEPDAIAKGSFKI